MTEEDSDYYALLDAALGARTVKVEARIKRSTSETQKYITRIAITTEVARLVMEDDLSDSEKLGYFWDLIRALDFSDEWTKQRTERSIGSIYEELKLGNWRNAFTLRNGTTGDAVGGESGEYDNSDGPDDGSQYHDDSPE